MYTNSKVAILLFPSFGGVPNGRGGYSFGGVPNGRGGYSFGGVPNGRDGPLNENEIEKAYVHDIRHCQNRILKI